MNTMKTAYSGSLRTQATHLKSGSTIITDAPTDNHGRGEAFSPTDLVCSALSSCMITTMGIYAEQEGIDLTGLTADVTKIMELSPRKIKEIRVTLHLPGVKVNDDQKEKLKHTALTCPVALSLSDSVKQTVQFNF